jgi:hypothetical protein
MIYIYFRVDSPTSICDDKRKMVQILDFERFFLLFRINGYICSENERK